MGLNPEYWTWLNAELNAGRLRSINVIGVRQGVTWKIYAQKLEKQTLTIRGVTRIFRPE